MKKPIVSVVMPVYNAQHYLTQAIDSIRSQTYKHWEMIIVDDHSTDESWSIIQEYAQKDSRIRAYRNSRNLGVASTANKAIALAQGQYIARMDADDIAVPDRLAKQLRMLQKQSDVVAVGGQCSVIDHLGQAIGTKHFPTEPQEVKKMLFTFASIQQPTMMVNTSLLPKNFRWYESKISTTEEHALLFKLLQYGKLANLSEVVLKYRIHGKNVSLQTPKKDFYKILNTRVNAVKEHQYRPTTSGVIMNFLQLIVTTILPSKFMYALYALLRGLKNPRIHSSVEPQPVQEKLTSLSVFFPMHNEEKNIRRVVRQAQQVIPTLAKKYEILVINDGSKDKTSQIAHQLAVKDSHFRVIDQVNLGYGGALQTGFREAKYEWIFFADGDLQFDLKELSQFLPYTDTHKVVLGYRTKRADHWQRIALAKMLKVWNMIFFQFPVGIKDIDCAFKLFHRNVLNDIQPLESRGAMISTELLLKIFDQGYKAAQIGVTHYPRLYGNQTGAKFHVIRGAIKDTAKLFASRNMKSFLDKTFPAWNWLKSDNSSA